MRLQTDTVVAGIKQLFEYYVFLCNIMLKLEQSHTHIVTTKQVYSPSQKKSMNFYFMKLINRQLC